ncbi:MAG TPA: molecular chaperone TorD family protein [Vicinamibacterales bacterium]|nr:molecular chaperone TorD family protein [Vicinamibacterales bacterium]
MTATLITPPVAALLRDAETWRLISILLEHPDAGWRASVRAAADECRDDVLSRIGAAALDAREGTYLQAFGPGGIVSPREIAHRPTADPGRILMELTASYAAFAYRPSAAEPPDHVAVEAGFVAYLRLKEAFALAAGDDDAARVTGDTARDFIERHLSSFAEPIADRLAVDPEGYLSQAAQALLARTGPRSETTEGGWTPEWCAGCDSR